MRKAKLRLFEEGDFPKHCKLIVKAIRSVIFKLKTQTQSSKFHSSLRSSSANLLTSFAPLNLTKLKADLKSKPDASSKPYILQALRWVSKDYPVIIFFLTIY